MPATILADNVLILREKSGSIGGGDDLTSSHPDPGGLI